MNRYRVKVSDRLLSHTNRVTRDKFWPDQNWEFRFEVRRLLRRRVQPFGQITSFEPTFDPTTTVLQLCSGELVSWCEVRRQPKPTSLIKTPPGGAARGSPGRLSGVTTQKLHEIGLLLYVFFYNRIVNFFPRIQLNRPQPLKRPFNGFNRDSLYTYGIMKNFVVRTSRLRMINIKLLRFLIFPRWVRRANIQSQHLITDLCLESGIEISQIPKLIPFIFHSYVVPCVYF